MKKTGEILKQAREERGLSLNEVGLALKISNRVLTALEEGDLSRLPAKTFLRGFVQSYANYLKLNSDEVLAVFREEMGTTQPQPIPPVGEEKIQIEAAPVPEQESEPVQEKRATAPLRRTNSSLKGIFISVVCLVLVACIYMIKRVIERYQRETVTEVVEVVSPLPIGEESVSAVTDEPAPSPEPPPAVVEAPTPPVTQPPAAPAPEPKPAPTSPQEEKVAAVTPTPTPSPPKPEEKKIEDPPRPPARPLELVIEALDSVEIEYTNSLSGKSEKIRMSADQVHTIRGQQGMRLKVSNGGAVNVILNGKDMGVAGDLGKPATLSY